MTTTNDAPVSISVFGLGYVGAVTAACFARRGHQVVGVDVKEEKVALINEGRSPIVEKGIQELVSEQVRARRLSATTDPRDAVSRSSLSIVCVGTPSMPDGSIDTQYVEAVTREIGLALAGKTDYHVIVLRSTVLPSVTRQAIVPILESASRRSAGADFGVCFNPEFLREATAIDDFDAPPKTIIGQFDERSGEAVQSLYEDLPGPVFRTTLETAEMAKYADNAWHALKISYANEIGTLCKSMSVDSHELMGMFCKDVKLNLSPVYLRPGFAFGGSCLPKDLRAIGAMSQRLGLETPVLSSILPSNDAHMERALQIVRSIGRRKVGVLGVTFKVGTDDVRESPSIRLIELLRADGFEVTVYDEDFSLSRIMGDNLQRLLERIPDFADIVVQDVKALTEMAEVFVVTLNSPTYRNIIHERRNGQVVVDLVHFDGEMPREDLHVLC